MNIRETTNEYQITGITQCNSCNGTGLYQGMGERDGAFVVCYKCKGTGKVDIDITYNKFTMKKIETKCKRVYTNGMGTCITDKDIVYEDKKFPFSQYGCSYVEWLKGVKPKPLEFLGCPFLDSGQSLSSKDVNDLYKTRCKENLAGIGYHINKCKLSHDKEKCWEIYNRDILK